MTPRDIAERVRALCKQAAEREHLSCNGMPDAVDSDKVYDRAIDDAVSAIAALDLSPLLEKDAAPPASAAVTEEPSDIPQLLDELYWYHKKITGKTDDGKAWSVLFTEEHAQLSKAVIGELATLRAALSASEEKREELENLERKWKLSHEFYGFRFPFAKDDVCCLCGNTHKTYAESHECAINRAHGWKQKYEQAEAKLARAMEAVKEFSAFRIEAKFDHRGDYSRQKQEEWNALRKKHADLIGGGG